MVRLLNQVDLDSRRSPGTVQQDLEALVSRQKQRTNRNASTDSFTAAENDATAGHSDPVLRRRWTQRAPNVEHAVVNMDEPISRQGTSVSEGLSPVGATEGAALQLADGGGGLATVPEAAFLTSPTVASLPVVAPTSTGSSAADEVFASPAPAGHGVPVDDLLQPIPAVTITRL